MNVLRVCERPAGAVDDAILRRFGVLSTPAISDSLMRDPAAAGLVPLSGFGAKRSTMVGRALTVRTRPGDNLALHYALDVALSGDVIVVDGGGEMRNALLGELIVSYALRKGISGFVIDGAIRDTFDLRILGLPVFARGVSHRGPYKSGPGQIHASVSVGGTVVNDGDVVVGDQDGVVFISRARADEIAAKAEQIVESEQLQQTAIESGTWDRTWIAGVAQIELVGTAADTSTDEETE